jgi:hypothetical protein
MEWLSLVVIVVFVLAGISLLAYLKRIAAATERIADALERAASGAAENAPATVDENSVR